MSIFESEPIRLRGDSACEQDESAPSFCLRNAR